MAGCHKHNLYSAFWQKYTSLLFLLLESFSKWQNFGKNKLFCTQPKEKKQEKIVIKGPSHCLLSLKLLVCTIKKNLYNL